MLYLNLSAVSQPECCSSTSDHAMKTHADANKEMKKILTNGQWEMCRFVFINGTLKGSSRFEIKDPYDALPGSRQPAALCAHLYVLR